MTVLLKVNLYKCGPEHRSKICFSEKVSITVKVRYVRRDKMNLQVVFH